MKRIHSPILVVCCLLLLMTADAVCGVSDAAVLFLRIAPGARSAGMGEAFVAVSDDASATHWNPAGLGEYPLADSWYQFRLSDDTHLKDMARKALKGEISTDYRETFMSWKIAGNQISRFDAEEWKAAEQISIDPAKEFVANLARLARTDDRDLFKLATRKICEYNSGVSFEEINSTRLRLLQMVAGNSGWGDRVNTAMEQLLVVWQDLRFDGEAYALLEQSIEQAGADDLVGESELGEIEQKIAACEIETRPSLVEVPYPVLLSVWRSWEVPWEENIEKIAVMENSVPNDNYTRYDVWAVTNFGLKRFDGVTWRTGMNSRNANSLRPKPGDNITDIISRVLSTTDEATVQARLGLVAQANNGISLPALLQLKEEIAALVPPDLASKTEVTGKLEGLEEAWTSCLIDSKRLGDLTDYFRNAKSDSVLSDTEVDRILFSLEKAVRTNLPPIIEFPYNAVFDAEIYDIAVNKKTLMVATSNGLYRFNGNSWDKFSTGIPDEPVYCIQIVKRNQYWIGTDMGVKNFAQSKWTTYGPAEGVATVPIKHIFVKNERTIWAAADKDLFRYDGNTWKNSHIYTTTVTDSARSVYTNFYGDLDEVAVDLQVARLEFSNQDFCTQPTAGVQIEIPFTPLFEGNITALTVDNDNNLWVGTELGIKRFDGNTWRPYGYKAIKLEEDMTIEELASQYLKTSDPDKIAGFVGILKRKNTIQQGKLPKGRVVYVYANPAGSPINSLYNHGGRVYVGSLYGTFSYKNGVWERYYREDLHRLNTKDIVGESGEMWFATSDRVIVYAHAKREFSFTHSKWLPELASDLYYEFFTYVQPVGGLGTVGANITFLSFGEIARTSENNPEILETFSSFDGAFTLSYGIRTSKNMSIGLSAKIIYSKLADQGAGAEMGRGSGTSFAVDAGLIYHLSKKFTLGAAITNLGPDMSYIDAAQSDPLPRNLAVGFAFKILDTPYNRLTIVGEVNKLLATVTDDFSTELEEAIENIGIEYWYGSLLALRAGYYIDNEGESTYPTLGLGLQLKDKYRIDFAYIPTSEEYVMGNTLRTSLTVRL